MDGSVSDARRSDAGSPDAGSPDAGVADAALPDAATPDAAFPDASAPDAAGPDAAVPVECYVPGTHPTIQAAVDDPACFLIHVAPGTYSENITIPRDVAIRGPETAGPAIVDGGGLGSVVATAPGTTVELRNLTIQNGFRSESYGGAGVYWDGELSLYNCSVVSNAGHGLGSGWEYAHLFVVDSVVAYNTRHGIHAIYSPIHVIASDIHDNSVGLEGQDESAIEITSGSTVRDNLNCGIETLWGRIVISDSVVSGNRFGLCLDTSALLVTRSSFVNNWDRGLRLVFYGTVATTLEISDTLIADNGEGGARITFNYIGGHHVLFDRCLVANNSVGGNGAGLAIFAENMGGGSVALVNTTVSGNGRGLNIVKYDSALPVDIQLSHVTITENHLSTGVGAGIRVEHVGDAVPGTQRVTIRNSVMAGNTAMAVADDCASLGLATVTSSGFNVFGAMTGCTIGGPSTTYIVDADPLLEPLADNGGPTFTHALLPGSPAIDPGHPSACATHDGWIAVDQRSEPRALGLCDSGAFELGP